MDFNGDLRDNDVNIESKKIVLSSHKIEQSSYVMDILSVIGVLGITMIASSLIMGVLVNTGSASKAFALFLSYTIPFSLTIIFAIWLFLHKGYKNVLPKFSMSFINAPLVLYGCVLLILSSVVLEPVISIFPKEWMTTLNKQIGSSGWSILTTIVMAPILEEILFRGVIQEIGRAHV